MNNANKESANKESANEYLIKVAMAKSQPAIIRNFFPFVERQFQHMMRLYKEKVGVHMSGPKKGQKKYAARRDFWLTIAGCAQVGPDIYDWYDDFVPLKAHGQAYLFPIIDTACFYQGRAPAPSGTIYTGIGTDAHKMPQTTKWGNRILKGPHKNTQMLGNAITMVSPGTFKIDSIDISLVLQNQNDSLSFDSFLHTDEGRYMICAAVRKHKVAGATINIKRPDPRVVSFAA